MNDREAQGKGKEMRGSGEVEWAALWGLRDSGSREGEAEVTWFSLPFNKNMPLLEGKAGYLNCPLGRL